MKKGGNHFLHLMLNCDEYLQARSDKTGFEEFGLFGFSLRTTFGFEIKFEFFRFPFR